MLKELFARLFQSAPAPAPEVAKPPVPRLITSMNRRSIDFVTTGSRGVRQPIICHFVQNGEKTQILANLFDMDFIGRSDEAMQALFLKEHNLEPGTQELANQLVRHISDFRKAMQRRFPQHALAYDV